MAEIHRFRTGRDRSHGVKGMSLLLVAVLLILAAVGAGAATAPPDGRPHLPAPTGYPNQLHPIDVRAMTGPISPEVDPCPWSATAEARARCWMKAAFPPDEWAAAWHVVSGETGPAYDYDPLVCNGGARRGDAGCPLTPSKHGGKAVGLWQHRYNFWAAGPKRAMKTAAALGYPDAALDIWDGWHSTLVAAWLAGTHGWAHFDTCRESDRAEASDPNIGRPIPNPRAIWCGPGRWLR